MKMSGEQFIAASRQEVWRALNDPEVLKKSIPGCQELQKTSDTGLSAKVTAKVGPVKANFAGDVTLSDLKPPESYVISGQGKGGAAGFAKGGADVKLTEQDGGTLLSYDVNAQVGGKLAQIGSRLIQSTARKMADDFFKRFAKEMAARATASESVSATPDSKPAAKKSAGKKAAAKKAKATSAKTAPTKKSAAKKTVAKKKATTAKQAPAKTKASRKQAATTPRPEAKNEPVAEVAAEAPSAAQPVTPTQTQTEPTRTDESKPINWVLWMSVAAAILFLIFFMRTSG